MFPSADPLEYCNQTGMATLLKGRNDQQQQLPLEFKLFNCSSQLT